MIDWFDPAYKAGGPIRSAVNFVQHMEEEYDLFVFTGNTDLNQTAPLTGIVSNKWVEYSRNVKVFYADRDHQRLSSIRKMMDFVQADFIYLNSVFSTSFTIFPLLLKLRGLIGRAKLVLSPRGMLRPSALQFKPLKKRVFLFALKITALPSAIKFIATDASEANDIKSIFGNCNIQIASNFGAAIIPFLDPIDKIPGEISIIFIGRVHPIKNLDFLLRALLVVKGKIRLTIVGVLEDASYWEECKRIVEQSSTDLIIDFKADIPHHELSNLIANHHIFALPTQGENYGHAIFESLSHGKPVVISDQTPWRNLEQLKAGWDLPLNNPSLFSNVLQTTVNWNSEQYKDWSLAARKKAELAADHSELKNVYKTIFT